MILFLLFHRSHATSSSNPVRWCELHLNPCNGCRPLPIMQSNGRLGETWQHGFVESGPEQPFANWALTLGCRGRQRIKLGATSRKNAC